MAARTRGDDDGDGGGDPSPAEPQLWSLTSSGLVNEIAENLRPGLTVAFISVPLSISLAVASQATPGMGTATAIYGGLFGALVGGSSYNIQGPTGALSPILAWYSVSYGQQILPWLAIGAGLLSIVAYVVRIDAVCAHITPVVMEGFNLGVAFTIASNQIPYGLGIEGLYKHRHLYNNIAEFARNIGSAEPFQSSITIVGFLVLVTLNRWRPKFPWFLCIGCLGILFGYMVENDHGFEGLVRSQSAPPNAAAVPLLLMNDRYPPLKASLWSPPSTADWSDADALVLLNGSLSVMLLAVFETLISGKLADKRTGTQFDPRMEVLGVGFANMFCGMAGGFPCTAALARTTLNIRKGATSRVSAIISSLTVYAIVKLASTLFMYLPLPFVAAMMLTITYGMPDWRLLAEMAKSNRVDFTLVILVAVACIIVDPGIGLLTGIGIEFCRARGGGGELAQVDDSLGGQQVPLPSDSAAYKGFVGPPHHRRYAGSPTAGAGGRV